MKKGSNFDFYKKVNKLAEKLRYSTTQNIIYEKDLPTFIR